MTAIASIQPKRVSFEHQLEDLSYPVKRTVYERVWQKMPSWRRVKLLRTAAVDFWTSVDHIRGFVVCLLANNFFSDIFHTVRSTSNALVGCGKLSPRLRAILNRINRALVWTKFFALGSICTASWSIGINVYRVVRGFADTFDCVVEIIKEVGKILGHIATVSKGLAAVGFVAASKVAFAVPLAIIGTILGLAGQVYRIRSLWQTHAFARQFAKACDLQSDGAITDENFKRALDFLIAQSGLTKKARKQHYYRLGKHFNYFGKPLNHKLRLARKAADSMNASEKAAFIKLLRHRITAKQHSVTIDFVNFAIGFVAMPIFVLSPILLPPLLPLAFACVALSAGGAVGLFALDWFTEHRFGKSLNAQVKTASKKVMKAAHRTMKAAHRTQEQDLRDKQDIHDKHQKTTTKRLKGDF